MVCSGVRMRLFPRSIIVCLSIFLLLAACAPATGAVPTISPLPATLSSWPTTKPTFFFSTATTSPTPAPPGWCSSAGSQPGSVPVIGYLPDYETLNPDWGNCLTDLIYFSAEPRPDGSLDSARLSPANLQTMREMKARYGTRIYISLGGYERSADFSPMVTNLKARQYFITNLLAFARDNDLDGVDFDWEFPAGQAELDGYLALMNAVKQAGLIISVALYPYPNLDLKPYLIVDRLYIMSYDRGIKHSTFEQAVLDLDYFMQAGLPRAKLFLGVPFYGRQMTSPYTAMTYAEIMKTYSPSPGIDEVGGVYFNGIATIQKKVCYVRQNGFGGIMIWELGQDSADDTSLLRAVSAAATWGCQP